MNRREFVFMSLGAAAATGQPRGAELPQRQIHLDFHTSELIPDVGVDFDADEFARTLLAARVNSINVFAKCHHGYAYYDTKIAVKHPALQQDLLGEMVRVCRRANITVNYYYSLVWDVLQSRRHPEWLALDAEGKRIGGPPTDAWPWLCLNTPYLDQVEAENQEILDQYAVNGVFYDILKQPPGGCYCRWCVADRQKRGLTNSPDDLFRHNKLVAVQVEKRLFGQIRRKYPNALSFFNSRLVIGVRDELDYYSHIEVESLPTGGWGYTHFQQRVRYMRTLGKDYVGMTGRFHKSWGDFGGLKNQAALDYECLNFIANGAKACVGDQLHPRGRLDATTYRRIGRTYQKLEGLEPWCRNVRAVADIGVISTAATNPDATTTKVPPVDQGFTNALLELHHQFDVLDLDSDFDQYPLLIVPDEIRASENLTRKLRAYLQRGGAMILSGTSCLENNQFTLGAELGVRYLGPAKFKGEYMTLKREAFPQMDEAHYFLYQPGVSIAALPGTEVLATYAHPYFDRSPERFVSHKQTPVERTTGEPLITRKDRVVYIANPFFRSYSQDAYGVQKLVLGELIRQLLPRPAVLAPTLPSGAQITVLEQRAPGIMKRIVHLLYYPLTRRAPDLDIIEEPGLLENVPLQVRMPQHPLAVNLLPDLRPLQFSHNEFWTTFTVPRVYGHQAIVIE
jgi:hypothetical protein